jgi:hypothetical protein
VSHGKEKRGTFDVMNIFRVFYLKKIALKISEGKEEIKHFLEKSLVHATSQLEN